ncbi:hypothetical protein [Methylococcus capsulatus]|jgi:hypothetical protein|nr:hypothetical protein [Methylococcus capsulatus]QXP89617.1 hypothetical protein KW114_10950 [Methylococcus capsulatus]
MAGCGGGKVLHGLMVRREADPESGEADSALLVISPDDCKAILLHLA